METASFIKKKKKKSVVTAYGRDGAYLNNYVKPFFDTVNCEKGANLWEEIRQCSWKCSVGFT